MKEIEKEIETLRPKKLKEYVGQEDTKEIINIYLKAAVKRNETPDHLLFHGPSGLGKTTLAEIIASELNTKIKIITGGSLEKTGDLIAVLTSLEPGMILFIDEIHRLPKFLEEVLYSAMEDYVVDVLINKDSEARTIRIDLNPFTLIGATTMFGDISSPLRSRFGAVFKLNYYSVNEIKKIIKRTARIYECKVEEDVLVEIAKRSRFTPRIANRLFLRIRDFADVLNNGVIDKKVADKAFKLLKITDDGLNDSDKDYLLALINQFDGGPVGLDSVASAISEAPSTLTEVYEPFLIKEGYIKYTPRGRVALDKAYTKFKKDITKKGLF